MVTPVLQLEQKELHFNWHSLLVELMNDAWIKSSVASQAYKFTTLYYREVSGYNLICERDLVVGRLMVSYSPRGKRIDPNQTEINKHLEI